MREIKFRAWDKKEKRWVIYEDCIWLLGLANNKLELVVSKGIIPVQYTGLKDKNGKEIYEGDIIGEFGENALGQKVQWIYQVCFGIYDNGESYEDRTAGNGWYLESISNGYIREFTDIEGFLDGLKIIGNIYENPQLLEGKNGNP